MASSSVQKHLVDRKASCNKNKRISAMKNEEKEKFFFAGTIARKTMNSDFSYHCSSHFLLKSLSTSVEVGNEFADFI